MSEPSTFVGPKRAAEKMARTRAIPGVAERARFRAETLEAGRVHAESFGADPERPLT